MADIRAKKLDAKMDPKEKAFYINQKKRFAIGKKKVEKETDEDIAAVEEFRRLAGLR